MQSDYPDGVNVFTFIFSESRGSYLCQFGRFVFNFKVETDAQLRNWRTILTIGFWIIVGRVGLSFF